MVVDIRLAWMLGTRVLAKRLARKTGKIAMTTDEDFGVLGLSCLLPANKRLMQAFRFLIPLNLSNFEYDILPQFIFEV